MKKVVFTLLLLIISVVVAEEIIPTSYSDFEIVESKRAKSSGIAMMAFGTSAIAGGAALIYTGINEESGFIGALGGALVGVGVYLDVHSIFMFKKSKDILREAKEREPLELGIKLTPNSISLVGQF